MVTYALNCDLVDILSHENLLEKFSDIVRPIEEDPFADAYGFKKSEVVKVNYDALGNNNQHATDFFLYFDNVFVFFETDFESSSESASFIGIGKGIQGGANSSIMDATIAALFSFNPTLDIALYGGSEKVKFIILPFQLQKLKSVGYCYRSRRNC